ncbi:MAG: CpaE family protein [Acidimicrobiia bacterium]
MGPEIGLAASTRDWSDRFHRFLLDHGGGTVRSRIMSPAQAVSSQFDVLFIDDVCSFLNQRLVIDVRASGKSIVGVFDPSDGTDAKRRLLEAGIGDVIESDARPEEFLEIAAVTISHSAPPRQVTFESRGGGFRIGFTGPPGGVGITEIACALALDLSRRHKTALVDANPDWPSIGQRLGLPVYPNLRTGIDFVLHEPDRLEDAAQTVGALAVIPGPANPGAVTVSAADLVALISGLGRTHSHVVVDLGHVPDPPADVLRCFDAILVVGTADPVGVTRLARTAERVANSLTPDCEMGLVVNRVEKGARERAEVVSVLAGSTPGLPVILIPEDRGIRRAARDGSAVERGRFHRSVRRLGRVFDVVRSR